jgi:hypothetical protein
MSNLNSFQRKLVYLGGVLLLLIPITLLGMPPEPSKASGGKIQEDSGGLLARRRIDYELGENSLGGVDAASSTMTLLLLGFRGIATSLLWVDAQELQNRKDWAGLRATTNSIILLQPHFLKVWHFQGWNLAYNVSAEWDAVADRYYWVKEGIKFFKQGITRNEKHAELYWYTGDTTGKKIGRSDEWREFRGFFRRDPNTQRYGEKPDPEINPEDIDNYLEAKKWFINANTILEQYGFEQHIMAAVLFDSYPDRAQIEYAMIMQREGLFDEVGRLAWEEALKGWTDRFGSKFFKVEYPGKNIEVKLELNRQELEEIRAADRLLEDETDRVEYWTDRYRDMANYRFWRLRCEVESKPVMLDSHRELYQGEQAFLEADFTTAEKLLLDGMAKLEEIINAHPEMRSDDTTINDAMMAQRLWRECLELDEREPDEAGGYPLQSMWIGNANRLSAIEDEFRRKMRSAR